MARGARRWRSMGTRPPIPDELCDPSHTTHAVCGMLVDPAKVLILEVPGRDWLELLPWCETCREYVRESTALVAS
jgi:hypothetical protein